MLQEAEILKLIENGENSYVEFKEEAVSNKKIAQEMIAFSNHKGGYLLLGVADDKKIAGLARDDNEERVMNISDDLISPPIYPTYYETKIDLKRIAIIEIEPGVNKPYFIPKGQEKSFNPNEIYIRQGSKTRKIKSCDELQRLFQASGNLQFEISPASYATLDDLDLKMAENFFHDHYKSVASRSSDIKTIMKNLELLVETEKGWQPTVAGILLFGGERIKQVLPQSGITCIKIDGDKITDKKSDHQFYTRDAFANFDDAWHFFYRYNTHSYEINGPKRVDKFDYPENVFREVLANAVIHRDYTIAGSEIFIMIYNNRIEIKSPGSLPNTITVEKMKFGSKYHRNPVLAQFFALAGIVEMLGQGIPIADQWLRENGNPELQIEEKEQEVVVMIFKG